MTAENSHRATEARITEEEAHPAETASAVKHSWRIPEDALTKAIIMMTALAKTTEKACAMLTLTAAARADEAKETEAAQTTEEVTDQGARARAEAAVTEEEHQNAPVTDEPLTKARQTDTMARAVTTGEIRGTADIRTTEADEEAAGTDAARAAERLAQALLYMICCVYCCRY